MLICVLKNFVELNNYLTLLSLNANFNIRVSYYLKKSVRDFCGRELYSYMLLRDNCNGRHK